MNKAIICFLVFFLLGCGPKIEFQKEINVGDEWSYSEHMDFTFFVKDTSQVYNLEYLLTHSETYPYQNLYVKINTTYPDGKVIDDILSLQLASTYGEFEGKCASQKCTAPILLQERFRFRQLGQHSVSITQYSRKEDQVGVYSGKLRLVEAE